MSNTYTKPQGLWVAESSNLAYVPGQTDNNLDTAIDNTDHRDHEEAGDMMIMVIIKIMLVLVMTVVRMIVMVSRDNKHQHETMHALLALSKATVLTSMATLWSLGLGKHNAHDYRHCHAPPWSSSPKQ